MTFKLVGTGHALTKYSCRPHKLQGAILHFMSYDSVVEFQATAFYRLAEVNAEDRLEKCCGGSYDKRENGWKEVKRISKSSERRNEKTENVKKCSDRT